MSDMFIGRQMSICGRRWSFGRRSAVAGRRAPRSVVNPRTGQEPVSQSTLRLTTLHFLTSQKCIRRFYEHRYDLLRLRHLFR